MVLWNGALATATPTFDPQRTRRDENGTVGTMTAAGPLDSVTVPLWSWPKMSRDRAPGGVLTHPLELLGITTDPR